MERIDVDQVIAPLKGFQRCTVDYVFKRMYLDEDRVQRFLVADEVGLGKTLVGRGLIARVIDHLWDQGDQINIVYICSNANIARQNINRLNVTGEAESAIAHRLTLLPLHFPNLSHKRINFLSLTPGTSFDLKSSLGVAEERVLLYHLLQAHWGLDRESAINVFRGYAAYESFAQAIRNFNSSSIEQPIAKRFLRDVQLHIETQQQAGSPGLLAQMEQLCRSFEELRVDAEFTNSDRALRNELIGELRLLLAKTCIQAIKPDLIILDEFQRFKHLLNSQDQASKLAHELFNYATEHKSCRVVLLSATPYKMYTLANESDDDHYVDFVGTLKFLLADDKVRLDRISHLIRAYRQQLLRLEGEISATLRHTKEQLETELRRVMVRTERLAVTEDRNGMLAAVCPRQHRLEAADLHAYLALQKVAELLNYPSVIELWKSAPYLLNFMEDYQFKRLLQNALQTSQQEELAGLLADFPALLLNDKDIQNYQAIDPQNARLRSLLADTVDAGLWQLLWLPPTLPYYALQEPFASVYAQSVTKRLVFSSWRVAPKVISTLLSYSAERLMTLEAEEQLVNTPEARRRRGALLHFAMHEGRPTTMSLLTLLFPSITLAEIGDPLVYYTAHNGEPGQPPAIDDVLYEIAEKIEQHHLPTLKRYITNPGNRVDERWYWAAPLLLDRYYHPKKTHELFSLPGLAQRWIDTQSLENRASMEPDERGAWQAHVAEAQKLLASPELGPMPKDIGWIIALMALASPGAVALRALSRLTTKFGKIEQSSNVRLAAGQIAWSFRSLFNLPEATTLLRSSRISKLLQINSDQPYWQRVLYYSIAGCLQSVMDEYVHVLRDSLGLVNAHSDTIAEQISLEVRQAIRIRTANVLVDNFQIVPIPASVKSSKYRLRHHFAMRFGNEKGEDERTEVRAEQVRQAFNSPFWPFVLATTSIGQEGLDFHPYCHAVVHWNLPSNPIDLEQREGRVHRYKGHAIRKNVAKEHAHQLEGGTGEGDPWEVMFQAASKPANGNVIPYWVYPIRGGVCIHRYIMALPWSSEVTRFRELSRSLAAYRLVFGQPRQEDLLEYLSKQTDQQQLVQLVRELRINLEPPATPVVAASA